MGDEEVGCMMQRMAPQTERREFATSRVLRYWILLLPLLSMPVSSLRQVDSEGDMVIIGETDVNFVCPDQGYTYAKAVYELGGDRVIQSTTFDTTKPPQPKPGTYIVACVSDVSKKETTTLPSTGLYKVGFVHPSVAFYLHSGNQTYKSQVVNSVAIGDTITAKVSTNLNVIPKCLIELIVQNEDGRTTHQVWLPSMDDYGNAEGVLNFPASVYRPGRYNLSVRADAKTCNGVTATKSWQNFIVSEAKATITADVNNLTITAPSPKPVVIRVSGPPFSSFDIGVSPVTGVSSPSQVEFEKITQIGPGRYRIILGFNGNGRMTFSLLPEMAYVEYVFKTGTTLALATTTVSAPPSETIVAVSKCIGGTEVSLGNCTCPSDTRRNDAGACIVQSRPTPTDTPLTAPTPPLPSPPLVATPTPIVTATVAPSVPPTPRQPAFDMVWAVAATAMLAVLYRFQRRG
ncbi:MAG: hypothetical protein HY558_04745 [Euryarchaeota archaeon]|nr:hypothetical protein [Euryarchaeota archaeon]